MDYFRRLKVDQSFVHAKPGEFDFKDVSSQTTPQPLPISAGAHCCLCKGETILRTCVSRFFSSHVLHRLDCLFCPKQPLSDKIMTCQTFQLEMPPSWKACTGPCPLLGRPAASMEGPTAHLVDRLSTSRPSRISNFSLERNGKFSNFSLERTGKFSKFSLASNDQAATPFTLSTQPAGADPDNQKTKNLAAKEESIDLAKSRQEARARKRIETEKEILNKTSPPIAQWVAQVVRTIGVKASLDKITFVLVRIILDI